MKFNARLVFSAFIVLMSSSLLSCSYNVAGNENGSEPINEQEQWEYQKAVNRCHRTGGTRVVKIKGELKCY